MDIPSHPNPLFSYAIRARKLNRQGLLWLVSAVVVTVATGTVDVWHAAQWGNPIRVRGGQQVRYTPQRLSEVQSIDLTNALAWRRGQVIFGQKPLSDVIDEVNRYRSGRIVILNPSIRHRPVTGAFDIQRLGHVIDALRLGLGFHVTALTPYLILLR